MKVSRFPSSNPLERRVRSAGWPIPLPLHLLPMFLVLLALAQLLASRTALAIDPEDVKEYGEVFMISAQAPDRERVELTWEIAKDYYLYNNRFLAFSTNTPGITLGQPRLPKGKISFDELLGEEVEKYTGKVTVEIPLQQVMAGLSGFQLRVRSQGCLENMLCYPPTEQVVLVGLPGGDPNAVDPLLDKAAAVESVKQDVLADPEGAQPAMDAAPVAAHRGLDELNAALKVTPGTPAEPSLAAPDSAVAPAQDALEAEQAFVYEAIGLSPETALVRFTAQPGYYLYRNHFTFQVVDGEGFEIREVELPAGVIKDDPEFGPVPVIYGQVEIPVRFTRPAGPVLTISLQANFQGCRDGDICYPPQSRVVSFEMPAALQAYGNPQIPPASAEIPARSVEAAVNPAGVTGSESNAAAPANPATRSTAQAAPVSEQDRLASLLTANPSRALFAFFIAGILLAFTPCVFPMVPILSGIIAGQGDALTPLKAFWLSLVYVLAMAVTYTVAGVLAGLFGQNLQAVFQNPWIISAFVLVFVALALSMFGFFELQLPGRLQTRLSEMSGRQQGGSLLGVAVMGFLSALIVGPCVAPPLMAALIVIGASGDAWLGGSALFALSLGMGLPLIAFGVSAGKLVPRAGAWMVVVKNVFGVGLLALAIWMLERILPGGIIMLLWGVLAIACGIYLGAFDALSAPVSGWKRLWKSFGLVLVLMGAVEIIGAAAGGDYWLRPLESFRRGEAVAENQAQSSFGRIKSLAELRSGVAAAQASGKVTLLDFYADWCVECIRMERNTFHEPEVQALLAAMQPLQADVTANDETDQQLMREFGIIGPPAILFFDRAGQEMKAWRLVGYFPPEEFAAHLESVLAAQ
jgi:thiol:disulfide interchange protein DsbD